MRAFKPRWTLTSSVDAVFAQDDPQDGDEDVEEGEEEDEDKKFQSYDPILWETAVEQDMVEKAPGEEAPISHAFEKTLKLSRSSQAPPCPGTWITHPVLQETEDDHEEEAKGRVSQESEFVRALKNSMGASKPYFRKGDILRVINTAHRGSLAGKSDTSEIGCRS